MSKASSLVNAANQTGRHLNVAALGSCYFLLEVWERTLGQNSLCHHSTESEHGQATVDDFLQLQIIDLCLSLVLEETTSKSKVSWFTARSIEHLHDSKRAHNLRKANPKKQLSHTTVLNKSVMSSDGGESFVGLRKRVDPEAQVNSRKANNGQHANTSMLQFGLAKEVDGEEIREAERVESIVTDAPIQIRGSLHERKRLTCNILMDRGRWTS